MCQYLQERGGYPQWTYGRNGMQKSSSPCVGLRLDYILEDVCDPILRKLSVFQPSPEYQVAHEASWHPWSHWLADNYQFFRWSFQTPWLAGPCRRMISVGRSQVAFLDPGVVSTKSALNYKTEQIEILNSTFSRHEWFIVFLKIAHVADSRWICSPGE